MVKKVKNNDGIEVVVDDLLTKEGEVEDIDTEEVMEDINEDSNADDSVIIDTESLEVNEDPVLDGDVRIVINGTVFVLDEELAENIESQQGYPLTEIKYNIPIYHK